VKNLVVIIFI